MKCPNSSCKRGGSDPEIPGKYRDGPCAWAYCPWPRDPDYLAPGASELANAAAQRDPLLVERAKTHGDFVLNATISQKIKEAIAWGDVKGMKPVHREALDMIALKISRICSGQANYADHWDDIAGYAKLGSEATKP